MNTTTNDDDGRGGSVHEDGEFMDYHCDDDNDRIRR